jgi:hypothetical protein
LQLATRKSAVLFDLLTLAPKHPAALDACLLPLFESSEVLKLGFGLTGDLAKLAGSWPDVQAFRVVAGVLDLRPLWVAYGMATRRQVRGLQPHCDVCTRQCIGWQLYGVRRAVGGVGMHGGCCMVCRTAMFFQ